MNVAASIASVPAGQEAIIVGYKPELPGTYHKYLLYVKKDASGNTEVSYASGGPRIKASLIGRQKLPE